MNVHINAVAYQEGEVWIIQGIEYDIVAFASDISKLTSAFAKAVVENACITEHLGRFPLAGIKPAPEHFKRMFEVSETELRSVKSHNNTIGKPVPDLSIRLADIA